MSTHLTPDAEQHYRIIRQKMDTVGGIFETVTNYYAPCHSSERGAFIPDGNDFVRVSASLHTMGAEWVPVTVPESEYGYEHVFGLLTSKNTRSYDFFLGKLWDYATPLMSDQDQVRAKTKTEKPLAYGENHDALNMALRFERNPKDNDGRPIPLHTIPYYIKTHVGLTWLEVCQLFVSCILPEPVTA